MTVARTVGQLLRDARIERGLSQRELAELGFTVQSAISDIETGVSAPKLDTLERIAASMGFELRVQLVAMPEWTR